MNEQVKELMGKTLDSEFSYTWDTMTYEDLLQFSEKFAELIVRKCMDVVSKKCASPTAYNALAEHFGVEHES